MVTEAGASMADISTAYGALSFISKGLREVRDSADADIQLIRNRASSFSRLAKSLDKELENFIISASAFSMPAMGSSSRLSWPSTGEIDIVKKLQPKLSEFRRVYSSPELRRMVIEKWQPKSRIKIDLPGIKNAIIGELEDDNGVMQFDRPNKDTKELFKRFIQESCGHGEHGLSFWEPIKKLKARLWEFDNHHTSAYEFFKRLKTSELVGKVKSTLGAICKEPGSKDVPPLDIPELLAYLLRQSGPILDQIGVRKELRDKVVKQLWQRRSHELPLYSLSNEELCLPGNENIDEDLGLRITDVIRSTGHCHEEGFWNDSSHDGEYDGRRRIAIVTTASLPWMTGTAINPLFRAAYLAKSASQQVTLMVPWLCCSDQELVYPDNLIFHSPEEQEAYIRCWLEGRIGFKSDFKITFYPGKFSKEWRSIIPSGDTTQFIPMKDADIAVLEEPEHINWYHHGVRWTDKFNHVVGIVHTNYLEYIKREKNGAFQAFLVKHINDWVTRVHCHKVLRLSAATQALPRSIVCNVHGVNPKFLKIGEQVAAEAEISRQVFSKGAYFLGKMVWAKGYKELLNLLSKHRSDLEGFNMDVFGNGEDAHEVQNAARNLDLNVNFLRGRDHADDSLHSYKVFINPSISDVVCTATAEALAMGKFVVCADHPSNEFFRSFPNCLIYKTSDEFVLKVKDALTKEPLPLTPQQRYDLSWEAATQRFIECSELGKVLAVDETDGGDRLKRKRLVPMPGLSGMVDGVLAFGHYCFTGSELLRLCTGGVPGTRNYDREQCIDLNLLPPQVSNPVYGW